ncbi:ABC transporter substrate-binding protein [Catenulispora subtropica]|uniref:Peptide ABC transporter substrate-binding protein n=1 Tax=Catenulispora subtropica TaxID=450798 RepID=A0ABN2SLT7_9ACTN
MNRIPARLAAPLAATAAVSLALSGCSGKSSGAKHAPAPSANIDANQLTTGTATGPLDSVTWSGDYRAPYSLDPLKTADYPEETILGNVCEPLLRTNPDYSLAPGLAKAWSQSDPTHIVFDLNPAAHFSDGKPVTPEDVVFSLKRNTDPNVASNYADSYNPVADIAATGASQVTITLSRPNYLFVRNMGILAGAIVEKANTVAAGSDFGSATGKLVCSGPFTVDSFDGTNTLVLKKDPNYWDTKHAAKVGKLTFSFPQDPQSFVNGLTQGTMQGAFDVPVSALSALQKATDGKLYVGGEGSTTQNVDLIVSKLDGGLKDPAVRQALSLAIDRAGIAKSIYAGAADPLYAVAGPGFFTSQPDQVKAVYQAAYDKLKVTPDLKKAADMVDQAGAKGKTVKIAYAADGGPFAQLAQVLQQTGNAIGLDLKIVGLPMQQYGSLFTDPKARADYDGFLTLNYMEFPDVSTMYTSYATKDGVQNFNGYDNATVQALVDKAAGTDDLAKRADFATQAQAQVMQDLPWIPIVAPRALVWQGKQVTGAPLTFSYMSYAWGAAVGAP